MNSDKLIKNIIDQIKEAQIKLGYVKETVRLYYPVASLNSMLGTDAKDGQELLALLKAQPEFSDHKLGTLQFTESRGRIEVSIPPEGSEYVHRETPEPAFLKDIIQLFGTHHNCDLKDICNVFEKYSSDYVCKKMPEGTDFDYVLYFHAREIDPYYYCIKAEMGHTIYHRFTKEDYEALMEL